MACGDVVSLESLQTQYKHQIFEAEVITGKAGGVAGGATIDYATNQVTGQTQKTMPAILRDTGFRPASFTFATGGTLAVGDSDVVVLWPVSEGGDGQYYIWKGTYPKVIPASSSPATAGGVSDAGWLPWGDITLRDELSSTSGAGIIGTTLGGTVQSILSQHDADIENLNGFFGTTVNIADYANLKEAIAALSVFGGTVYVPVGNFFAGDWTYNADYMSKANISIVGQKMPTWNSDASALTGGSIIEGRFNAFADNFSVENVGFDMGENVIAARYGGADTLSANHPLGGTWDAFAFAQPNGVTPLPQRRGFSAKNVISLCKQSGTVGHAFLAEGFNGGFIDNVIGIYSIHATVIKSQNVRAGSISGYMSAGEGLIIKSDTYAPCGDIQIASVWTARYLPNCTPHATPSIPNRGLYLHPATANFTGPIQIGNVVDRGANNSVSGDTLIGTDIQIGSINSDGFTGATNYAVNFGSSGAFRRINIGQLICNNVVNGVYANHPAAAAGEPQINIGSMQVTFASGAAITAAGFAKVTVDSLEMKGVATAYNYADASAKIRVGNAIMNNVTNIFQSAVALAANWVNFGGGNPDFIVDLHNYKVRARGLVKANAGAGGVISSLITAIRPTQTARFLAYKNTGSRTFALIGIDPALGIVLDDGTAPATGNYVSLENIMWEI